MGSGRMGICAAGMQTATLPWTSPACWPCAPKHTPLQLKRAVDCFEHCVALLDLEQPGWKIMYVNAAWSKVRRGLCRKRVVGARLVSAPQMKG